MTSAEARNTAKQVLQIIPLVMRVLASNVRHSRHDIVPAHFRVLGMLCHRPHTLTELAESQAVSLPTMSNTVAMFEERGWVTRLRSNEDRRVVLTQITEEGRATLEHAHRQAEERLAEYLVDLSAEDRETLLGGLAVLHRVFEAALTRAADDRQHS